MLFAGLGSVRMEKNCDLGRENAFSSPRSQVFTIRTSQPANNIYLLIYGKVNPSVVIGSFLVRISPFGPFPWKRSSAVYFLFSKAGKFKTSMARVPYNKLLTNLASSSCTREYWRSVRTATTSGQ